MRVWQTWVARCDRPVQAQPLVLTRILLATCVLLDLLRIIQLDLLDVIFKLGKDGGLTAFHGPQLIIHDWWGPAAGPIALGITVVCMLLVIAGYGTRLAILVGVLAYSQLGHLFPPGDRAVDRVIRTGLLIVMCSGAAGPWWKSRETTIRGWSIDLVRYFLVMIYLSAGLSKLIQQPGWLSLTGAPPLLRILADPLSAHLAPVFWHDWTWLFRLGSWGTIALELSAILLLTRWCRHWAIFGALMHVGIFVTMGLGMFSLGMLSFYPVLFAYRGATRED